MSPKGHLLVIVLDGSKPEPWSKIHDELAYHNVKRLIFVKEVRKPKNCVKRWTEEDEIQHMSHPDNALKADLTGTFVTKEQEDIARALSPSKPYKFHVLYGTLRKAPAPIQAIEFRNELQDLLRLCNFCEWRPVDAVILSTSHPHEMALNAVSYLNPGIRERDKELAHVPTFPNIVVRNGTAHQMDATKKKRKRYNMPFDNSIYIETLFKVFENSMQFDSQPCKASVTVQNTGAKRVRLHLNTASLVQPLFAPVDEDNRSGITLAPAAPDLSPKGDGSDTGMDLDNLPSSTSQSEPQNYTEVLNSYFSQSNQEAIQFLKEDEAKAFNDSVGMDYFYK